MLSTRGNERLAGVFLVTGFAAFFGHFFTLGPLGMHPVTVMLVMFYGFLVMLSALALYASFHRHGPNLALYGACGYAVHGLFVVVVCSSLLAAIQLEAELATPGGPETESAVAAIRAIELAMDKLRLSAFLALSLGLAALGVLIARTRAVARWVGWLGGFGGVVGFLVVSARLFGLDVGGFRDPPMLTVLLTAFGFMLVLGVRLLAREMRAATAATR